ncbi:NADPH-adrenodoxin reductase, partial [Coemansia sp. RSA 475]
MSFVIRDLLHLAAEKLVVGGRLVYWLPTVAGEYTPHDVPEHPVLQLVANSEQPFGSWSRRLITMEKIKPLDSHEAVVPERDPAHKNFRDRLWPARVAVVGGGAAGFYTAARVLAKTSNVGIDIFEQQIPPYGLVRYGVAPDHLEVKNCISKFASVAMDPRVRYFGNTRVGTQISVSDLRSVYDAVVLAYGASEDKRLGIGGEDGNNGRVGVVSARMFVAWYNGLPEAQDLHMDLT